MIQTKPHGVTVGAVVQRICIFLGRQYTIALPPQFGGNPFRLDASAITPIKGVVTAKEETVHIYAILVEHRGLVKEGVDRDEVGTVISRDKQTCYISLLQEATNLELQLHDCSDVEAVGAAFSCFTAEVVHLENMPK